MKTDMEKNTYFYTEIVKKGGRGKGQFNFLWNGMVGPLAKKNIFSDEKKQSDFLLSTKSYSD